MTPVSSVYGYYNQLVPLVKMRKELLKKNIIKKMALRIVKAIGQRKNSCLKLEKVRT